MYINYERYYSSTVKMLLFYGFCLQKVPGVVAFYSAKDIPGENTFTPSHIFIPDKEKV